MQPIKNTSVESRALDLNRANTLSIKSWRVTAPLLELAPRYRTDNKPEIKPHNARN